MIDMAKIYINSKFGATLAKPMQLVDIHDVQPMADEENINNSSASDADKTKSAEVGEQTGN